MLQGHPCWQNEKYGNISYRNLCFICHQNVNHDMLYKSKLCLGYVEKWNEVLKCIEMNTGLIINGSTLHAIDVTEHPLDMSYLYKVAFIYQLHTSQIVPNSQMNTEREEFQISVHAGNWKQQPPCGLTLVLVGMKVLFIPQFVSLKPVYLTQWWDNEGRNICLHREILPHTRCMGVTMLHPGHGKLFTVVTMVIRLYFITRAYAISCFLNLDFWCYVVWYFMAC